MKTKQYLLTALCTLCCALFVATDAVAQRVKPTLPEPATIEEGQFYYLWNEEAQLLMTKDWSYSSHDFNYYSALNISPDFTVQFVASDRVGRYYMQKNNNIYYFQSTGSSFCGHYEDRYNYCLFGLTKQSDGTYTINRYYNYTKGQFVAPTNKNLGTRINADVTDSTYIKWRLIPDSCALDVARMALYLQLEQVDSTFNVEPYDEILANSTSAGELFEAAKQLNTMMSTTNQYQQRSWTDYNVQFINDPNCVWTVEGSVFTIPNRMGNPKTTLKAIVDVDVDDAVLYYEAWYYGSNYSDEIDRRNELNVYIDGKLVRTIKRDQIPCTSYGDNHPWDTDADFYERLTKGTHLIEWEYLKNGYSGNYNYSKIGYVGVKKAPEISVSLLEPGSLGTEILAQVNSVLDVRRLKIKGEMNAEDWKTISLIDDHFFSLDLSEAIITEIPDDQFNNHETLHEIKLPEGLTRIGDRAFCDSHVEVVNFPSTLTSIGQDAFRRSDITSFLTAHTQLKTVGTFAFVNCRYLEEVTFPEAMTAIEQSAFLNSRHIRSLVLPKQIESMGTSAFNHCDSLRGKIVFPEGLLSVPGWCFQYCGKIDSLVIPNSVTSIDECAIDLCTSLKYIDLPDSLLTIAKWGIASSPSLRQIELPKTLKSIGHGGFAASGLDSIVIPENTTLAESAFDTNLNLKYAELPTSYYNIANKYIFRNCNSLNRIKIKSPTLLHGYTGEFVSNKGNITLVVPDYLVSSYKLDSYWYTYKDVEGFGTSEVDTWTINNPVTLGATSRFQGSPNVIINRTNLTVNGETGMELNDLNMEVGTKKGEYYSNGYKYYYNLFSSSTQLLSSADISVNGKLTLDYYTNANQWAYIALPFDIRVGDIETDAQYAIRYYDGANRAANLSAKGNWKNYGADDIIPAGTGFVYQTSKDVWNTFVAYDNVNKNRAWAARDLSTPLDSNACASSEHRGWNLVGNPWMTHFNIHAVDFTAPITVYDQYYRKYQAYSIIDDNVALHPTQAFFVQCPDDIEHITFPARGRQLTNVVTDQNGARAVSPRRLVDVTLSMGDLKDQTRVVMNDRATLGYDYGSDAGKFFAEDEEVLQLYTTDAMGTCYAINERPTDDCTVGLAYMAPTAGDYTLALPRNQAGRVVLKDLLLGTETNLAQTDYTFTTDAGTYADRFVLVFASIGAMGLQDLQAMPEVTVTDGGIQTGGQVQVYTSDGRLVAEGEGFLPLQKGFYVVRAQGESKKVVIK